MFLIVVLIDHLKYVLIMETNKNNSNEVKQFAIGTKIEHNGKLYEVVQGKFCNDCSIASICSSNDITSGNRIGDVLSRDKRLSIFGECSPNTRDDNTSIVFKEIPMTKSDNNNINRNIIQPLVEANGIVKALQIKAPTNFEIDTKASDLAKGIIKFKNKWLTIEQLYKLAKENNHITYRDAIKYFSSSKLVALANLMDIAKYFNGCWEYNITKGDVGYAIAYYKFVEEPHYSVCKIDNSVYTYYGNPVFKNEADAQYVIDNPNFRDVLDMIFKV